MNFKHENLFLCFILYFLDFGLPSELSTQSKNPHCLNVTWKKACGPVTGYKIYCFLGDSEKAEIVKDIHDGKQESVVISGLKPDKIYRIGITSVSSDTESKLVFQEQQIKMRKSSHFIKYIVFKMFMPSTVNSENSELIIYVIFFNYDFSWNSSFSPGSEPHSPKEELNT